MKKTILSLLAASAVLSMTAGNGIKVYINPGHGGHDADDRNVVIYPYAQGDPEGYWESNSNLEKGLALRDMLQAKGYTVGISRVTNTTADDLGLSTISRLANDFGADLFFSIHSNATGTAARRNFPLMLFRGYDVQPVKPNDKVIATILNQHLLENEVTYWTSTATNVRGDWDFYKSWGTQGLGVLRNLTVIGMLSEGSFHDYIPEAYRLMNKDFCWLEAYHFRRAVDEYFKQSGESKGHIFGRLNDGRLPREGSYLMYGDDLFATVQGATVELYDASNKLVKTYTTESKHYNGVYGFRDLAPGTYTIRTKVNTHYDSEKTVEVKADLVTYANFQLAKVRDTAPEIKVYSPVWKEGDAALLCNTPITIEFNWDMDIEATAKAFSIEPAVDGKITWEDLNYRMVFTPTQPYATNTLYTVRLAKSAAHGGGMTMAKDFSFTFRTTDRNFMEITGQSPAEGDMVHFHGAAIEMRFDKNPNTTNILNQVKCIDSKGTEVTFDKRGMKQSKSTDAYGYFRIPFLKDLTPGETYTVLVSGELGDKDGITLKDGLRVSFTACDAGADKDGAVIEEMGNASDFVFDADQSIAIKSNKVANDTKTNLFGSAAVAFTYAFSDLEGGEALWNYTAEQPAAVDRTQTLGVHIYGDLSSNPVYLMFSAESGAAYVKVTDMTFLGWRYIEVPLSGLESDGQYLFKGVKVVQNGGGQSTAGTFELDRIFTSAGAGVDAVAIPALTLGPVPADEFLVANADCVITSLSLVDTAGRTVAQTTGNALYVGNIPAGSYIAIVTTEEARVARKVVVKH